MGVGLDLEVLERRDDGVVVLTFEPNVEEPFLDHHRPGGNPLLGTAVGIELMTRGAIELVSAPVSRLSDIQILAPLIIPSSEQATVHVRVERRTDGALDCAVGGRVGSAPPIAMFTATVHTSRVAPTAPGMIIDTLPQVGSDEIYELFFHGPAFQVIHGATFTTAGVVCQLAEGLPPLTSACDPIGDQRIRRVEACLQTAGLLEVASTHRMMIPGRIAELRWFDGPSSDANEASDDAEPSDDSDRLMTAQARRLPTGDQATSRFDISLVDQRGAVRLAVLGYETCPLPFHSDRTALLALAHAFAA